MTHRSELEQRSSHTVQRGNGSSSVIVGAIWMVVISLLLFWLPAINGLIAGAVGGYKVGSVRSALIAAILPAIIVAAGLWLLLIALDLPLLGIVAGFAVGILILLADVGLFLGAVIGGVLGNRSSVPAARALN